MQAIAITPGEYALNSLKSSFYKLNDTLYGTQARAQRSITLAFLTLVLLQIYGQFSGTPVVCGL